MPTGIIALVMVGLTKSINGDAMRLFNTAIRILRTFDFISLDDMVERTNMIGIKMNDRTLRNSLNDPDKRPNFGVIESVSELYGISKGFLLDGDPRSNELYGVAHTQGQEAVAFLIPSVRKALFRHSTLCPANSVDNLRSMVANRAVSLPNCPVKVQGVIVGYAHTTEVAKQLEEEILVVAASCLNSIRDRAHRYLLQLN